MQLHQIAPYRFIHLVYPLFNFGLSIMLQGSQAPGGSGEHCSRVMVCGARSVMYQGFSGRSQEDWDRNMVNDSVLGMPAGKLYINACYS